MPFLDERGKPYQYMAMRYEITERKRAEERLREQEALARLGQMAAVVAHEVKNPIAGIRGALQVIASRMPAESRDKPVVGDIIARLDALNGIVHDLLVFARPRQLRAAAGATSRAARDDASTCCGAIRPSPPRRRRRRPTKRSPRPIAEQLQLAFRTS